MACVYREMKKRSEELKDYTFDTVYFGGGTPSYIPPKLILGALNQIRQCFTLADEVEIQVAYAIGVANPVSVFVDSHGTGKVDDETLVEIIKKEFDLRPYAIIKTLDLRKPVFKKTAAYGHFGYKGFTWEQTDRVEDLQKYLA
jgi:hypothetical protein